MSKPNKVNPGQYYVGGRLTPDDMARERMKQQRPAAAVEGASRTKAPAARRGKAARESDRAAGPRRRG